ncbi:MAG: hypothetical protein ACLUNO_11555 [Oscillospiraceae bacterium]
MQTKTKTTGYYVGSRTFEVPELKLLVDSVQSSKFITHKKTWRSSRRSKALPVSTTRSSCSGRSMSAAASRA